MSAVISQTEHPPFTLHFGPVLKRMSNREFFEFCQANSGLRLERTSEGDLIVMPPTGGNIGRCNFMLNLRFGLWSESDDTGIAFDSSTGFMLPNGAMRAPDLAWVLKARWEALSEKERDRFPPLCPDFVVELRSRTDRLDALKDKLQEYIDSGAQLGWLIDPDEKTVYIYRPDVDVVTQIDPETLSGDPLLPGFILNLRDLWR